MGFQKPSSYKTVIDFKLEKGKVIEMKDRSEEAAIIRGKFHDRYNDGLINKIDEAFSLEMGFD